VRTLATHLKLPYVALVEFSDVVDRVRSLVGRPVSATLLAPDGRQLARWEGELAEEELDSQAIADRMEPRVAGHEDAEQRVRALRDGDVALFTVGGNPLVVDRIDTASAEPIEPEGVRMRDAQGMTVELVPLGSQ
jgi:hypothetical protein